MAKETTKTPRSKKPPAPKADTTNSSKPLNKALGPASEEFGQEIKPLGKEVGQLTVRAVRTLLIKPVAGIVSGIDSCGEWVANQVADKLKSVPDSKLVEPEARIAWPALQACVYTGNNDEIKEMFVNLLASDMNSDTKSLSHPAFVEIIKQMTGFEARVLRHVKETSGEIIMEHRRMLPGGEAYNVIERRFSFSVANRSGIELDVACSNLSRLGLMDVSMSAYPMDDRFTEMQKYYREQIAVTHPPETTGHSDLGIFGILPTPLGGQFSKVCL